MALSGGAPSKEVPLSVRNPDERAPRGSRGGRRRRDADVYGRLGSPGRGLGCGGGPRPRGGAWRILLACHGCRVTS
jgi:hypothetical protein